MPLVYTFLSVCVNITGLLLFFICTTKTEKHRIEDNAYSSGILLPSNTEAPGDEVVNILSMEN